MLAATKFRNLVVVLSSWENLRRLKIFWKLVDAELLHNQAISTSEVVDALRTVCMFDFCNLFTCAGTHIHRAYRIFELWLPTELCSVLRESEDCSNFGLYPDSTRTSATLIELVLLPYLDCGLLRTL